MPKATKKVAKKTVVKETEWKSFRLQKKVVAAGKKANAFAKKNPWALAGITAGLGLAVGMLSQGKKKAKKKK